MTVSIGVVTNEKRRFTHAAQVSALATEMKSYAKTLPGSVFSIDRRTDAPPGSEGESVVARWPICDSDGGQVNVSCPECRSVFRVDPAKVPPGRRPRSLFGVRRRDHRWRRWVDRRRVRIARFPGACRTGSRVAR